jgi:predicted dehydrogenase
LEELRVGLLGCGRMGRDLVRACKAIDKARLTAVCDLDADKADSLGKEHGVPGFSDAAEFLRSGGIDAVIVATPQFAHREGAEMAAAAGKHVFCEKPMAVTVADCDAMIAACKKAGVKLMIGQVLRYLPTWNKSLEIVRSGALGKPIGVSVTRIGGGFGGWFEPWRGTMGGSGGILMEINSHEIDFMRCLAGEVESVFCMAGHYVEPKLETPDLIYVLLRFKSGAIGHLHSSMASAIGESSAKIQCEKGSLFYRNAFGMDSDIIWNEFGKEPQRILTKEVKVEDGVVREVREFVESVLEDKPATIPGEEGRANVEAAVAAYESARTGKLVKLPMT